MTGVTVAKQYLFCLSLVAYAWVVGVLLWFSCARGVGLSLSMIGMLVNMLGCLICGV